MYPAESNPTAECPPGDLGLLESCMPMYTNAYTSSYACGLDECLCLYTNAQPDRSIYTEAPYLLD